MVDPKSTTDGCYDDQIDVLTFFDNRDQVNTQFRL
jgi:hypothetical protein